LSGNAIGVQLLLDSGADAISKDRYGRTALGLVIWKGYEVVVRLPQINIDMRRFMEQLGHVKKRSYSCFLTEELTLTKEMSTEG
jgi:hypothetical protein